MLVLCIKERLANNKNYLFARQVDENVLTAPDTQVVALSNGVGL